MINSDHIVVRDADGDFWAISPDEIEESGMTLDIIQKIVVDTYAEGSFSHITSMEEAAAVGDTLFLFLMRELGYTENCQTVPEAIRRVDAAIADLNEIRNALFDSRQGEMTIGQEGAA